MREEPRQHQRGGRQVRGDTQTSDDRKTDEDVNSFFQTTWGMKQVAAAVLVDFCKVTQNEDIRTALLSTYNSVLLVCDPPGRL